MESDEGSLEQYERRLFAAWCAFEAGGGPLSRSAALELCDALQLERRGTALVDELFQCSDRVTFGEFRSGLLAVLGASCTAPASAVAAVAAHSDDSSSGREAEAAPRLVVGAKRYGRRSRPPRPAPPPVPLRHDTPVDAANALALCRGLRMDGVDRALVERIFEAAPAVGTTVGEFFDRLNAELGSMAGAGADASETPDDTALPAELVVEAWERAGVQHPRRLLAELGFDGAGVSGPVLDGALERESAALEEPEARALVLQAALALSRLRIARAQHATAAAAAEREKLRADVAEGERRARLLAQEVDDSQARLEAELAATLRRAEARHAEAARLTDAELAAERERADAERGALRAEIAKRAESESRLRTEVEAAAKRVAALELRGGEAEQRAATAERERVRLAERVRELESTPAAPPADAALQGALQHSRAECMALRDRCDELAAQLEARAPPAAPSAAAASLQDEAAALGGTHRVDELCDSLSSEVVDSEARQQYHSVHQDKLPDTVRELEAALEAMKEEYERCEEYWEGKLRDERALHAAEQLAEQRASDERLGELLARVQEYERRWARPLPAIPEAGEELERELATARRQHAGELAALRLAHARELRRRDARLRRARLAVCAGAAAQAELRATLAAAEAAGAALAARLASTDLLVKDLYVENCLLAPAALRP